MACYQRHGRTLEPEEGEKVLKKKKEEGGSGFVLIIMQGRVEAGVSFAFTNVCGPQPSLILLFLGDSRKNRDYSGLTMMV